MDKEKEDNLKTLSDMLKKEGIEHTFKKHAIVEKEPQSFELLGYWITGEHQIIIKTKKDHISIIRGYASFGKFEMFGNGYEAERWETEEEIVKELTMHLSKKQT